MAGMAQQFALFNLDKKQYLSKSGNISELMCSGTPPGLVHLLVKPGKSHRSVDGLGEWAGHRLVCAGDRMKDCPNGMLNSEEEHQVHKHTGGQEFYQFARDAFNPTPIPSYPPPKVAGDQVWVLRNLSKHVYVRADVLSGKPGVKGPFFEPFGFGDLLLANITWSTDQVNMEFGHVLVLGPWAGDRFDIVSWDVAKKDIKKEKKSNPWKDVSEEQAKRTRLLLADIF